MERRRDRVPARAARPRTCLRSASATAEDILKLARNLFELAGDADSLVQHEAFCRGAIYSLAMHGALRIEAAHGLAERISELAGAARSRIALGPARKQHVSG